MKIQSVVLLIAVLMLTILVAESECIRSNEEKTREPGTDFETFTYQINASKLIIAKLHSSEA